MTAQLAQDAIRPVDATISLPAAKGVPSKEVADTLFKVINRHMQSLEYAVLARARGTSESPAPTGLIEGLTSACSSLRRELLDTHAMYSRGSFSARAAKEEIKKDLGVIVQQVGLLPFEPAPTLTKDFVIIAIERELKKIMRAVKDYGSDTPQKKSNRREPKAAPSVTAANTDPTADPNAAERTDANVGTRKEGAGANLSSETYDVVTHNSEVSGPLVEPLLADEVRTANDSSDNIVEQTPALAAQQQGSTEQDQQLKNDSPPADNLVEIPASLENSPQNQVVVPDAGNAPTPLATPNNPTLPLLSARAIAMEKLRQIFKDDRSEEKKITRFGEFHCDRYHDHDKSQGHPLGFCRVRAEVGEDANVRVILNSQLGSDPRTRTFVEVPGSPTLVGRINTSAEGWENGLVGVLEAFAKDTRPVTDTIAHFDGTVVEALCQHTELERVSGATIGQRQGFFETKASAEKRMSIKLFTNSTNQPEQMAPEGTLEKLVVTNAHAAFACEKLNLTDVVVEAGGVLEITATDLLTIKSLRVKKGGTVILHSGVSASTIEGLRVDKGGCILGSFRGTLGADCHIHGDARKFDLSEATFGKAPDNAQENAPKKLVHLTRAELKKNFKGMLFTSNLVPADMFKDISRELTEKEKARANDQMGRISAEELMKRLEALSDSFVKTEARTDNNQLLQCVLGNGSQVKVQRMPLETLLSPNVAVTGLAKKPDGSQDEQTAEKMKAIEALNRILEEAIAHRIRTRATMKVLPKDDALQKLASQAGVAAPPQGVNSAAEVPMRNSKIEESGVQSTVT